VIVTATGGITVTVALLDFVGSATEVALTFTWAGVGTALGAVYRPLELTAPHVLPEHPEPETLHVTAGFVVLTTVAVNCCCFPVTTCAVAGATVTITGGRTVTVAEADFEVSALEVAVTVTWAGDGTEAGAV
jgi:hypothetical protein